MQKRGEIRDLWTPTVLNDEINASLSELYDLLIDADEARYLVESPITVVAGTADYAMPATFYLLVGVDVADSSMKSGYRPLERYAFRERHLYQYTASTKADTRYEVRGDKLRLYPTPTWAGTIQVAFIPACTTLVADGDTFDGVNGWEEWLVTDVLIKHNILRREVVEYLERRQAREEARILKRRIDRARGRQIINHETPPASGRRPGRVA